MLREHLPVVHGGHIKQETNSLISLPATNEKEWAWDNRRRVGRTTRQLQFCTTDTLGSCCGRYQVQLWKIGSGSVTQLTKQTVRCVPQKEAVGYAGLTS